MVHVPNRLFFALLLLVAVVILLLQFLSTSAIDTVATNSNNEQFVIQQLQQKVTELQKELEEANRERQFSVNAKRNAPHQARVSEQILVLGMHHSATSIITKFLVDMGFYGGGREKLIIRKDNPLKYWELREAVNIDQEILNDYLKTTRNLVRGYDWLGYGFNLKKYSNERPRQISISEKKIRAVIRKMDRNKPWVIKDPRLSLMSSLWLKEMENPLCIIMYRNPVEQSIRFLGYNRPSSALNVSEWTRVWEEYTVRSVEACVEANAPIVLLSHSEMGLRPVQALNKLYDDLVANGVTSPKIKRLSEQHVLKVIGPKWVSRHETKKMIVEPSLPDMDEYLTDRAIKLWNVLEMNAVGGVPLDVLHESAWIPLSSHGKQAYTTIVTSDDAGYLAGAGVLASSIMVHDSSRDLVALVTSYVSAKVQKALKNQGWIVKKVDDIAEVWLSKFPQCIAKGDKKIRWGRMMSKLRLWEMYNYDTVVYFDLDTLVLRHPEEWFDLPGKFYGERSHVHKYFNAGIMVLKPSRKDFEGLQGWSDTHLPRELFGSRFGVVGCTEQELLNQYFNGSSLDVKLNNTRHAENYSVKHKFRRVRWKPQLDDSLAVHWISGRCPKPWSPFNVTALIQDRICDIGLYRYWRMLSVVTGRISDLPDTVLLNQEAEPEPESLADEPPAAPS